MFFGTHRSVQRTSDVNVVHGDTVIETVEYYKYLSIMLDQFLRFDHHVRYIRNKCIGRLKMLGKLRKIIGQDVSLGLYKSLISPLLDYGDTEYDCLSTHDSHSLQKIQNCALRIILQKTAGLT